MRIAIGSLFFTFLVFVTHDGVTGTLLNPDGSISVALLKERERVVAEVIEVLGRIKDNPPLSEGIPWYQDANKKYRPTNNYLIHERSVKICGFIVGVRDRNDMLCPTFDANKKPIVERGYRNLELYPNEVAIFPYHRFYEFVVPINEIAECSLLSSRSQRKR